MLVLCCPSPVQLKSISLRAAGFTESSLSKAGSLAYVEKRACYNVTAYGTSRGRGGKRFPCLSEWRSASPAHSSQLPSAPWALSCSSAIPARLRCTSGPGARKRTASLGEMSCPLLKSFTLAGFVFRRRQPLPEPSAYISLLPRSGWLMPLFSRQAFVRSPATPTAASCDWCWAGRSQGPNCQLWSLGDNGIQKEGGRSEVW